MATPFLVVAGATSGSGKTTLTAGIIRALRRRGLVIQPFKVGPDYIDPTYHRLAAGRACRNFDTWMVEPETALAMAHRSAQGADLAVVEGVMGLFDGANYDDEIGSTAQAAKLLGAPVVLVLDVGRAARSAAALALGFQQFDPALRVAGFIANRCGSAGHAEGVTRAIERATGLPVLGCLPKDDEAAFPARHLGLVPLDVDPTIETAIERAADLVERNVALEQLLDLAASAPGELYRCSLAVGTVRLGHAAQTEDDSARLPIPAFFPPGQEPPEPFPTIAVARDAAFSFYYEDNLDLLRAAGATLVFFSPLHDQALPYGISGLYLGGGFPELYAEQLSANHSLHDSIRAAHAAGLPVYAECGGFMFLTEAITDGEGVRHPMVGAVPGSVTMQRRRVRLGYCEVSGGGWLLGAGSARGHEFHWSSWDGDDSEAAAFVVQPRSGSAPRPVGYRGGSLIASYVHLHFASNPALARTFVAACRRHLSAEAAG